MKRKIVGAALLVALAVAAGWNFNQSKNETKLNDLALANVEALARNETCVDCYGFELVSYSNGCKICERESGKTCNIHDQVPC